MSGASAAFHPNLAGTAVGHLLRLYRGAAAAMRISIECGRSPCFLLALRRSSIGRPRGIAKCFPSQPWPAGASHRIPSHPIRPTPIHPIPSHPRFHSNAAPHSCRLPGSPSPSSAVMRALAVGGAAGSPPCLSMRRRGRFAWLFASGKALETFAFDQPAPYWTGCSLRQGHANRCCWLAHRLSTSRCDVATAGALNLHSTQSSRHRIPFPTTFAPASGAPWLDARWDKCPARRAIAARQSPAAPEAVQICSPLDSFAAGAGKPPGTVSRTIASAFVHRQIASARVLVAVGRWPLARCQSCCCCRCRRLFLMRPATTWLLLTRNVRAMTCS
jgi:hypothetical protein